MPNDRTFHDVYCYGVIAHSRLLELKSGFPLSNGYAEIAQEYENIGGEAANTAIVLARLGVKVKIDGNWLSRDRDTAYIQKKFNQFGIDASRVFFKQGLASPREVVVADTRSSRTIFATYGRLLRGRSWNMPAPADISRSKIVSLDPFFGKASLCVARLARKFRKPVISIDCKFDDPIARLADIVIISHQFRSEQYPDVHIKELLSRYLRNSAGEIIFTCGDKGVVHATQNKRFSKYRAFKVATRDTSGAGDAFRAGVIFGKLKKWDMPEAIEFAGALAAQVCQTIPGVLHSPSVREVRSLMKQWEQKTRT